MTATIKTHITILYSTMSILLFLAVGTNILSLVAANKRSPTILDTDFGSFIDDVFAVGLLLQSTDVLDPRLILTTSEKPDWSANCVAEQIRRSDLGFDIPVAIGETLPPYSERGTVCGIPGFVGFALKDTCAEPRIDAPPHIPNGVEYAAELLMESDRTDWTYIAIGGQTSLQKLIQNYPEAISKIENLVVMGGNWCTGFDAYPDVPTPTAETNIGCDMAAANFVLEAAAEAAFTNKQRFPDIYYVPVVTVNVLGGDDYSLITDAASTDKNNTHHNKAAKATIDFYKEWSAAARADPSILVHREAMTFDPSSESTPQFDAVAVLVAIDIVRGAAGSRVAQYEFTNGVHFVTNQQAAAAANYSDFFRGSTPKGAYSLWSGMETSLNDKLGGERNIHRGADPISTRCEELTTYHFDPNVAPPFSSGEARRVPPAKIRAALGFMSQEHEDDFFHEMALRVSGRFVSPVEYPCVHTSTGASQAIELDRKQKRSAKWHDPMDHGGLYEATKR
mmetsp:Transcript_17573/g.40495  ORF Transcript_17573/g.40495 Transcript_17573/m.40495 type:complete len:507 (-) Transcript_17573:73-1593(-)